jgi:hypothetical protein
MKRILLLALGICFLMTASAFASMVDFTTDAFAPAHDQPSFAITVDGIGLEIEAGTFIGDPANLWWDSDDGWGNRDGFGVQYGYEADEIEGPEYLKISFTSAPFNLEKVYITDLFFERGYYERGKYQLNGSGDWVEFNAADAAVVQFPSPISNGELELLIGGEGAVSFITFSAPGILQNGQDHEFAVAKIEGTAVPIPPAILLLGSGLIGLAGIRKKFKR